MVAVCLGAMKMAMVDASSCSRPAAVHPLRRTGEIADGIFQQQCAGFVAGEILHIDDGQPPDTEIPASHRRRGHVRGGHSPGAGPIADLSHPGPAYSGRPRNNLRARKLILIRFADRVGDPAGPAS